MSGAPVAAAAPPLSCYRLQLGPDLGFAGAADLVDYLVGLGVSHLYLSPVLEAAPGSTHGYDVVDPTRLSEALGGAAGFTALCDAAQRAGLGIVIDIVPNHMAVGPGNAWWRDLLEHGRASPYAGYFDVDWSPPEPRLRDVILLPILGDHYGRILEKGDLRLVRSGASFTVGYRPHSLPVAPHSLAPLLAAAARRCDDTRLAAIAGELETASDIRATEQAKRRLEDHLAGTLGSAGALDSVIEEVNADPDRLDALLDAQHYRLAYWKAAEEDLGYRRFFDIDALVGVRVENDDAFAATHERILRLVEEGCVHGLRVDHIDGLRSPGRYLKTLRAAAPEAWIVVEKILEGAERLPASWPVAGTTGYEFLNLVLGLFIDPAHEARFDTVYRELTGSTASWAEVAQEAKQTVVRDLLGADVARLTQRLLDVCERRRRYRDFTRSQLRTAVEAVLVALPVYRTYVDAPSRTVSPEDARVISTAIARAKQHHPELDPDVFGLIGSVWGLRLRGAAETEFVAALQQVSGPVMAKGLEDTAFYRYHRFVALNEVGGDPERFGTTVERFHTANETAAREEPLRMVTTSTHDSKRSEDVRARLAVVSERPDEWHGAVITWRAMHERSGRRIDPPTAYAFHQNLVGAWPISAQRMTAYMTKLAKEAKQQTSWVDPDAAYETELATFVEQALDDPGFTASVAAFVARLEPAASITALAQKLLCLTVPGVPDVYQGTETWHRRLVDPDNRGPVDYGLLRRMLAGAGAASWSGGAPRVDEPAKLSMVAKALDVRRSHPELFGPAGSYAPLDATGADAGRVVAFLRGDGAATVVPRLVSGMGGPETDTAVAIPHGRWRNTLTGDTVAGGTVALGELTARFPVALLLRDAS